MGQGERRQAVMSHSVRPGTVARARRPAGPASGVERQWAEAWACRAAWRLVDRACRAVWRPLCHYWSILWLRGCTRSWPGAPGPCPAAHPSRSSLPLCSLLLNVLLLFFFDPCLFLLPPSLTHSRSGELGRAQKPGLKIKGERNRAERGTAARLRGTNGVRNSGKRRG